jgi:hypothetical protein
LFVFERKHLGVKTTKEIELKNILSIGEVPKERYGFA